MIIVKDTDKETILKAINADKITIQGLNDTLTLLKNAEPEIKENIFTFIKNNAVLNGISEKAKREVSNKADFLETLSFASKNAENLLNFIESKISASKTKIYDTNTLTYKDKGMIDWLNGINFFGRYAITLINIILEQPKSINAYLAKVDFEFLNKTHGYFSILIKRLCDSKVNIEKSINMLSDETFDIDSEDLLAEIKGKQATTVGLMPHELNPVFWVNLALMHRDVSIIKRNKEEIDLAVSKIQKLEARRLGNPDPALEKQIKAWENEIRILNADIAERRAKYA